MCGSMSEMDARGVRVVDAERGPISAVRGCAGGGLGQAGILGV